MMDSGWITKWMDKVSWDDGRKYEGEYFDDKTKDHRAAHCKTKTKKPKSSNEEGVLNMPAAMWVNGRNWTLDFFIKLSIIMVEDLYFSKFY